MKTPQQQAVLMVHRARRLVMANRIAQVKQLRGLLGEFGVLVPQGEERLARYDLKLRELAQQSEPSCRLLKIESIGPMTATATVASMGDPRVFKSGTIMPPRWD